MATQAETMVDAIKAAMDDNVGVLSVTIDGTTVRYESAEDMAKAYDYWMRRLKRERGRRPVVSRMKLDF